MPTPNMMLLPPTVSVTTGPAWASALNACFDLIDAHDHSAGKGTPVTAAGLNINTDLGFNGNNAFALRTTRYSQLVATPSGTSDLGIVYVKNGELTYRDTSAREVPITSAGSIAGATGTISGLSAPASASFNAVSGLFSLFKDTNKPGKLNVSDIAVSEYNVASPNSITIKSASGVATPYSITLPSAVPTQAGVISMSTGGVLTTGLADGNVSAPGLAWASDLSTGFYRTGAGGVAFSSAGTQSAAFVTAGFEVRSGSAANPSYGFISDTTTGMYQVSAGTIGFTSATTAIWSMNSGGASLLTGVFTVPSGTAGAPSLGFNSDSTTGLYRSAASQISIALGGTASWRFASGLLSALNGGTTKMFEGLSSTPSYAFASDPTTGMYGDIVTGGIINFALTGTQKAQLNSNGWAITNGIQVGSSGGFFKVKIFTGSLSAGATSSALTAPSGNIISVVGWNSSNFIPFMGNSGQVGGATAGLVWVVGDNDTNVYIKNVNTVTQAYSVVMFYL